MARCFRDEDLRADRQPEFTQARSAARQAALRLHVTDMRRHAARRGAQLDIEMAFTPQEKIMELAEELMAAAFKARPLSALRGGSAPLSAPRRRRA